MAAGHARQKRLISRLEALIGLEGSDHKAIAEKVEPALIDDDGERLHHYVRGAVWKAISIPDPTAPKVKDGKKDKPDSDLRDYENVPFADDIDAYFEREVKPQAPEAWVDKKKTKVGYEIPFTRLFYEYAPPRPLEELDADIRRLEGEVLELLRAFDQ